MTGELLFFGQTHLPHGGRLVFLVHLATAIMHKTALHCYNYLYLASLAGKKMKKTIMHLCLSFTLVIATLNWQVLFVCDSFYDIYFLCAAIW